MTEYGAAQRFLLDSLNEPGDDDAPCVRWPFSISDERPQMHYNGTKVRVATLACQLRHGDKPTPEYIAIHGPCHDPVCIVHVRWGTRSENERDKVRDGTDRRGSKHHHARLTDAQVLDVVARSNAGESQRSIARRFGVASGCVTDIVYGKSWSWLTGIVRSG